jgi:hypothetical protein
MFVLLVNINLPTSYYNFINVYYALNFLYDKLVPKKTILIWLQTLKTLFAIVFVAKLSCFLE